MEISSLSRNRQKVFTIFETICEEFEVWLGIQRGVRFPLFADLIIAQSWEFRNGP